MSVYSGFTTRQQEQRYFSLSEQLVTLMQDCLLEFWKGKTPSLGEFAKEFTCVSGQMRELEKHKYLPPKFSLACSALQAYLADQFPVSSTKRTPSPKIPRISKRKHERSRVNLTHDRSISNASPTPVLSHQKSAPPTKVKRSSYYGSIFSRALHLPTKRHDFKQVNFPYDLQYYQESLILPLSLS
jgi:hypothetical protein